MERYLLQKSKEHNNWFVATDQQLGIVIRYEKGKFNETQKVTLLDDVEYNERSATNLAVAIRQLTDWIVQNHIDTLKE